MKLPQNAAKISCNHILGYSGHLHHLRNAAAQAVTKELISTYSPSTIYVWTGLEPINSSAALTDKNNWAHYYRDGTFVSAANLSWASGDPATNKRVVHRPTDDVFITQVESNNFYYICEYEEALKQPVTDLEKKCFNLTSSFKTLFVNDACYVVHTETKTYNDSKVSCKDISGYNGYLPYPRTMSELWIASAVPNAAGLSWTRLGIAHKNASSTDAYNGYYYTTSTNQSILTTFLPWATGQPGIGDYHAVAVKPDTYPLSFGVVMFTTLYPFLCQYDYTTTTSTTTPTTTTSTTTPTTTTSTTGTCAPAPVPTITGSATSWFYRYTFGHFTNPSYILNESTASQSMCLIMCQRNELCFGYTYNSGTSNCQLLAIIANELGCSSQLTVDSQFETFIHERQ
uniref:Apple domain-containing protein n=1 Tax=Plectus sambesii TaxID=2011161 RepID=A0A914WVP5_9BILA